MNQFDIISMYCVQCGTVYCCIVKYIKYDHETDIVVDSKSVDASEKVHHISICLLRFRTLKGCNKILFLSYIACTHFSCYDKSLSVREGVTHT